MTGVPIQQMADRVAALMEQRLRVRGQGLAEKLHKGGRLLPRKVRAAALALQNAAAMAQNPKLLLQVDNEAAAAAYDLCVRHLGGVSRDRRGALLSVAASVAFAVLTVAVLVVVVLYWRGLM